MTSLMTFSSLAVQQVVEIATSGAVGDENFVKMHFRFNFNSGIGVRRMIVMMMILLLVVPCSHQQQASIGLGSAPTHYQNQ